jgi:hypothetical protein
MPDPAPVYKIAIESKSDSFQAVIQDEALWVLPPGAILDVNCWPDGQPRSTGSIWTVHVDGKSVKIEKIQNNKVSVVIKYLYVQTTSANLIVTLDHGDVEPVTIHSDVDTKTRSAPGPETFTLRLK